MQAPALGDHAAHLGTLREKPERLTSIVCEPGA
jgi:hypothetical protein